MEDYKIEQLDKVDERRNRIDYNRAIEISLSIIAHCRDEQIWPIEHNEEMNYITEQLSQRVAVGGVSEG